MDDASSATVSTDRYLKKRDAILAAAAGIINRKGVKGMTLADVAASVGLITTSVTYYFRRKDALAAACFLDGIARLDALTTQALEAPDPPARLARLIELYLDLDRRIRAGEARPFAVFSDMRALGEPHRTEVAEAFLGLFLKVRSLFHAPGYEWLNLKAATARAFLVVEQVLWTAAWLPRHEVEDYPRVRDRMVDILIHGLAAPGEVWAPAFLARPAPADAQARSRESFLLAATRLINRNGYRGASVEQISAALNVTKGSFYHHNEAKDDLVAACFERSFAVVRHAQTAAMRQEVDGWTRLASAAAHLVEHQLSDEGPLLRSSAFSALPEQILIQMFDQQYRLSERFAAMIADGIADGSLRAVDPAIAAQMLNATLNAASELRAEAVQVSVEEVAQLYAKPMLMGLFSRYSAAVAAFMRANSTTCWASNSIWLASRGSEKSPASL
jgi:AcrR family transcriptional regulator